MDTKTEEPTLNIAPPAPAQNEVVLGAELRTPAPAEKFKTPEERQMVCRALIHHLENAWDQDSFEHCDWETVKRYMQVYPEDFPPDDIARAARKGHKVIENLLAQLAQGKLPGGSASAAIFLAKNKIGYRDRQEIEHTGKDGGAIKTMNVTPLTPEEAMKVYLNEIRDS